MVKWSPSGDPVESNSQEGREEIILGCECGSYLKLETSGTPLAESYSAIHLLAIWYTAFGARGLLVFLLDSSQA